MLDGLIDKRNISLLKELEKDYTITVELVDHAKRYGCYSIDQTSTIYVPKFNISAASFTHELLHIYLRSKGIFIGARITRKMKASKKLSIIYTEPLLEQIGNCLDHIKMLPLFLELGYERNQFIQDYHKKKCTLQQVEQITRNWKQGLHYNAAAIEFYLEKYFAVKACPDPELDYGNILQEFQQIDASLFSIHEKLIARWSEMKIDGRDVLEDDYIVIAENYIAELEAWARSKNFQ